MIFDSHIHTEFSGDSNEKIERIIPASKEKNFGIIATDHMDINDYMEKPFVFDVDDYFKKYGPLRSDSFLIGIEMGLKIESEEENKRLADTYDFDMIIGSLHAPYYRKDQFEYYDEPVYLGDTREGDDKDAVYKGYFENMLVAVERNDYFDTLAHIDYICRYARYEDTEIYYDHYKDHIDPVLSTLAKKGKALEISTRRIMIDSAAIELDKILKAFKSLGGEFVTIGSDSHTSDSIGYGFDKALSMIADANLTPCYFKERQCIKMT